MGNETTITEKIEDVFTYHAPDAQDLQNYQNIRESAKKLVEVIIMSAPASADRTAAIRKVREAVMTANAAIALKGRSI